MLPTTLEIIRASLKGDQTVTPEERTRILNLIRNPAKPGAQVEEKKSEPSSIIQRAEVAKRLGRCVRFVDYLAKEGTLAKVTFPGRKRSIGFRAADVAALIDTRQAELN